MIHQLPDSYRRLQRRRGRPHRRARLARGRRPRPLARARLPLLPRPEAVRLGRPGAAADLVEHLGVPDRAGRRPDRATGSPRSRRSSARCPTTCWCCRPTTSPSAACTRASTASQQGQARALERLRDALREPRRAVDVFGALFARPITSEPTCSAWPPAKARPTSTTCCSAARPSSTGSTTASPGTAARSGSCRGTDARRIDGRGHRWHGGHRPRLRRGAAGRGCRRRAPERSRRRAGRAGPRRDSGRVSRQPASSSRSATSPIRTWPRR